MSKTIPCNKKIVQEVNKKEHGRSASQGSCIPQSPACYSVGVPFTGWTTYGYWLDGQLLNKKEFSKYAGPVNPLPVKSQPESREDERKSWRTIQRENAARTAYNAIRRAQGAVPEYPPPSLDDWMAAK
jgi:hypothetical protein